MWSPIEGTESISLKKPEKQRAKKSTQKKAIREKMKDNKATETYKKQKGNSKSFWLAI